jgi:hypothetical protein
MGSADVSWELEAQEVSPSPFRKAFDRARNEALQGPGGPIAAVEAPGFEYRLVKRSGKRAADEADWNALGRKGWELVGVTRRHAAFKRALAPELSR